MPACRLVNDLETGFKTLAEDAKDVIEIDEEAARKAIVAGAYTRPLLIST